MSASRALGILLGLIITTQTVTRAVIVHDLSQTDQLSAGAIARLFGMGLVNDLLLVLLLTLPVSLAGLLAPRAGRSAGALMAGLLGLVVALTLLAAVADTFYWFEFGTRADAVVCCALPLPQAWLAAWHDAWLAGACWVGIAVLVALAIGSQRGVARALLAVARSRWSAALAASLILLAIPMARDGELWMLQGNASAPLDVAVSSGPLRLAHFLSMRTEHMAGVFAQPDPTAAATLLGAAFARSSTVYDDEARHLIVMVVAQDDAVRDVQSQGVYFDNMYATGFGGPRLLEGVLRGLPPLPGAPRNARSRAVGLPSLPRVLGRAGFVSLLVSAAADTPLLDESDWLAMGGTRVLHAEGESLSALLDAMDKLARGSRRIFAFTQATSAAALARFIDGAAQTAWFDDTLIAMVGMPAARRGGAALIPVRSLRVPALLVWRGDLRPRIAHGVSSTLDIPRTALSLLNVDTDERFFGRDLFGMAAASAVNVAPVEYDGRPGIVTRAGLTVLMRGAPPRFWSLGPTTDDAGPADPRLARLASAIYAATAPVTVPD